MKNLLRKTSLSIAVISALSLSSCLGDGENTFEESDRLAVIGTSGTNRFAAIGVIDGTNNSTLQFVFDGLTDATKYPTGDCIIMSYKMTGATSGNYYLAENVIVGRTYSKSNGSQVTLQQEYVQPNNTKLEIYPSSSSFNFTGKAVGYPFDRVLFSFKADSDDQNTNTKFLAELYYDEDNQKQPSSSNPNDTVAVGVNTVIIDVRFYKVESDERGTTNNFVADLSPIRDVYKADYNNTYSPNGTVTVDVKFRYKVANSKGELISRYLSNSYKAYYPKPE